MTGVEVPLTVAINPTKSPFIAIVPFITGLAPISKVTENKVSPAGIVAGLFTKGNAKVIPPAAKKAALLRRKSSEEIPTRSGCISAASTVGLVKLVGGLHLMVP